jgi:hypothetical protein
VSPFEQQPFNRLAFKASHNSYDQQSGPDLTAQLGFDPQQPGEWGCCGLELDLVQTTDRREWEVRHVGGWRPPLGDPRRRDDTHALSHWLGQLRQWGEAASTTHNPITVVLDLKEVRARNEQFADDLHGYLAECGFTPDCLFTPSDLWSRTPGAPDLVSAASHPKGWPSLGDLRGRFILVLSGSVQQKRAYAKLEDAWCFADRWVPRNVDEPPDLSQDGRIFVNLDCAGRFGQRLNWACRHPALFVRVYNVNSERDWREVRAGGANMLATDALTGASWAHVCSDADVCEWGLVKC